MFHFQKKLDELSEFETVTSEEIPSSRQTFLTPRMRLTVAELTIKNLNTQLTGKFIFVFAYNSTA